MRTMGTATVETGELSQLPAGPILVRLRRLLLTTAGAAAAYSLLSTGSVGTCTDSPNAGGSGTTQVTCANLVMHPSWIVYAAFAVILFVAIGRVARPSSSGRSPWPPASSGWRGCSSSRARR